MPLSFFNNLGSSIQETEHFLALRRSDSTHLKARYDAHMAAAPARSTRLNQLVRTSQNLMRKKAESRRKIEEEQQKLKACEEARAAIAAELESLQVDNAGGADLRQQILELQDEIVSIDDELQTFKQLARKIERRARQGRDVRTRQTHSSVPVIAESKPVLVHRQPGIEVRVPLKPPRRAASAPLTPDRSLTAQSMTSAAVTPETPGSIVIVLDGIGTRKLRRSRECALKPSIEFK